MATIPASTTTLRHTRKTIEFDGGAGSGATGTVAVFTLTGRVIVVYCIGRITESLVSSGGTGTVAFGVTGWTNGLFEQQTTAALVADRFWSRDSGTPRETYAPTAPAIDNDYPAAIAESPYITVATQNVTDGTVVIDVWYWPITDDGALAGDDHDQSIATIINAEADTALADYDPPTKAELDSGLAGLNDPTAASIADAVWDEATTGHTTAGTFGEQAKTDIDAILANTGTDGVVVAAASKTGYRLSSTGVDDILDEAVEGTWTFRQLLRLFASVLLGKVSGGGTTTNTFRDIDDSKDRVTATVTAAGNRTAVTKDAS